MSSFWLTLSFCIGLFIQVFGQTEWGRIADFNNKIKIEPVLSFQSWATYTQNMKVYNTLQKRYEPVEDRLNFQFRRARFGLKGQTSDFFRFTVIVAYDLTGRDVYSASPGGVNTGSLPGFGLWDAFGEWKLSKKKEWLNLTFGWFRPQFSRESITGAWATSSFEKAMSQNYIRTHLTGIGSGRASGLNVGGLLVNNHDKVIAQYNFGVFSPQWLKYSGNSAGINNALLTSARMVFFVGDPEMKKYGISYQTNYFNKRKGLSLGISYANQGVTDLFYRSSSIQPDILFNWASFNADAEWNFMQRSSPNNANKYKDGAGHIRFSNNITVLGLFLEPTFMYVRYQGGLKREDQILANSLAMSAGTDENIDLGVNLYFNQNKFKLALHYTWNKGNMGDASLGFSQNLFFRQNGLGAILRGNYWGLGLNGIF